MNDVWVMTCETSYAIDTLELVSGIYDRSRRVYRCLERWMTLREEKKNLEEYLRQLGIKKIAIYGAGILGQHLVEELKGSSIAVSYFIDRDSAKQIAGYRTISPYGELEEVDAIIITVVGEFGNVCDALKDKTDARLMGIEEMIYEQI